MASIPPLFYCDEYSTVEAPPPTAACGQFWEEETTNLLIPPSNSSLDDNFGVDDQQTQYYYSNCDQQQMLASLPQLNNMIIPSNNSMCACIHHHHNNTNAAASSVVGDRCNKKISAASSVVGDRCNKKFSHIGCLPPDDHDHFYEFPDDCFGLVPEIIPVHHPLPPHNWENQSNNYQVPVAGEKSNMKVGRYSEEVRKERILRYLKKRNQRNFNKTIKYACRKTLADRRIRVRGRFARNNEASDQQLNPTTKNIDTSIHKDDAELLYNNNHDFGVQMKRDEEEWLQEITSLMYLPYISS